MLSKINSNYTKDFESALRLTNQFIEDEAEVKTDHFDTYMLYINRKMIEATEGTGDMLFLLSLLITS